MVGDGSVGRKTLRLTVAQYVSSSIVWRAASAHVHMVAAYREDASALTANISLEGFRGCAAPRLAASLSHQTHRTL